jgi:hypothetical protein
MNRIPIMKLLVVLVVLLSIAGGPAVAVTPDKGSSGAAKVCAKRICCHMPCCAVKEKQPAEEKPAPVQGRVGQELAAAVTSAPFALLFTCAPTEARRAPRGVFADGYPPEPLAISCIQLI